MKMNLKINKLSKKHSKFLFNLGMKAQLESFLETKKLLNMKII